MIGNNKLIGINQKSNIFFSKLFIYLLIFGCAGSFAAQGPSVVGISKGYALVSERGL